MMTKREREEEKGESTKIPIAKVKMSLIRVPVQLFGSILIL